MVKLYAIKDDVTERFSAPVPCVNDKQAKQQLFTLLCQPQYQGFASSLSVYHVSDYDDVIGVIQSFGEPILVATGVEVCEMVSKMNEVKKNG